jgi:Domain of Unknown Function (DUF1259)
MTSLLSRVAAAATILVVGPASLAGAQQPKPFASAARVEAALGRKGTPQADGALKFAFPRGDMSVTVRGVTVKPGLALGSWLDFSDMSATEAMVMGDLVLAESEVGDVMQALQAGGVEPTALHNHVLGESQRVMYMHIRAHGDPVAIATTIKSALSKTKTPLGPPSPPAAAAVELDTLAVAAALGVAGKMNGPVYQVAVPRAEAITENGHPVPPSMGIATAINFQPTGGGKAAITGDFVLRASEVNAVSKALSANGIAVTAIHSHMLDEDPRLYFMHFWANADAVSLAKGLRAALDKTNSKKPAS